MRCYRPMKRSSACVRDVQRIFDQPAQKRNPDAGLPHGHGYDRSRDHQCRFARIHSKLKLAITELGFPRAPNPAVRWTAIEPQCRPIADHPSATNGPCPVPAMTRHHPRGLGRVRIYAPRVSGVGNRECSNLREAAIPGCYTGQQLRELHSQPAPSTAEISAGSNRSIRDADVQFAVDAFRKGISSGPCQRQRAPLWLVLQCMPDQLRTGLADGWFPPGIP